MISIIPACITASFEFYVLWFLQAIRINVHKYFVLTLQFNLPSLLKTDINQET